jgi:hypothetical protein
MTRVLPGIVIALAISTASLLAQSRDFAGNWTVDTERTAAANAASGGGGVFGPVARSGGGGGGGGRGGGGGVATAGGGTGGVVMSSGGGGGMRSGGGGRGGGPTVIAMDATTFTVGTTAYKLDGSTTTIETRGGTAMAKAAWKGDRLVIETTNPGAASAVVTTWYREGDALVRETSTPGPDGEPIVRKTFFKRAE